MTPDIAMQLLHDAGQRNPGPWVTHSILAGIAARRIALAEGTLDPNIAQCFGLLHDIGRIRGQSDLRHVTDGYHYLVSLGYPDYSDACLSHSFPDKCLDNYLGSVDVDSSDLQLIKDYLREVQFTDYDRLVQLCDFLASGSGYCLIEIRMVDTVLRHHITKVPSAKWQAVFQIMKEFDKRIGTSIYALLPGIAQGTFGRTNMIELHAEDPEAAFISW
jgi:hypothetical protein